MRIENPSKLRDELAQSLLQLQKAKDTIDAEIAKVKADIANLSGQLSLFEDLDNEV